MRQKISFMFWAVFLITCMLQPIGFAHADAGKVLFFDQNGQKASFNSADVTTMGLKLNLQKPLSSYKFDYLQVVISPSYNPKMEWRKGWMANEINSSILSDIALIPKSKLVNGYGTSFMLSDIKDYPSAKGIDSVTLNVAVKLYNKIGETKETKWDKYKEKFVTETIFQWGEPTQIASGSATFTVPKLSSDAKQAIEEDKSEKLKQLNEIRKKMGKPPLTKMP